MRADCCWVCTHRNRCTAMDKVFGIVCKDYKREEGKK